MEARIPASGLCGTAPCWKETSALKYGDKLLTPDGIQKATIKPGLALKAKIGVKGKGDNLPMPTLPLGGTTTVQLVRSDSATCWQATFSSPGVNDGVKYTAKSD